MLRELRARDDRGKPVRLWVPGMLAQQRLSFRGREVPDEVMDRVLSAWHDPQNGLVRASFTRANLPFIVPGLVFMLAMMAMPVFLPRLLGRDPIIILATLVAMSGGWIVLHGRWKAFRLGPAVRGLLLEEGMCASCAYSLRGLPLERDGCVVCPECTAAWRLKATDADSIAPGPTVPVFWRSPRSSAWWDNMTPLMALTGGAFGRPRVITVEDREGRLVEIVHSVRAARQTPGWREMAEDSRRDLATRIRSFNAWASLGLFVASVIYLVIAVSLITKANRATPSLSTAYLSSLLPLLLFGIGGIWFLALSVRPPIKKRRKLAEMFLKRDLCPCCLTSMSMTTPRCGVCGASWRAEDDHGSGTPKSGGR